MNKKSSKMYDVLDEERNSLKDYFESFNDNFFIYFLGKRILWT